MAFNGTYVTLDTKEYRRSINNFNMSILRQLEEIFPHIEVEFLKGICDAYKEEPIDLNILTDLVLSFEFPPLKDNYEQNKSEELTINNAAEKSSKKVDICLIEHVGLQQNKGFTSLEEGNGKSISSGNSTNSTINSKSNTINSIEIKNDNNSLNKQMTSFKSDSKDDFQYSLENTFLIDLNEDVKDIDHHNNCDLVSSDDFNNSEEWINNDVNIKEEPNQNKSYIQKSQTFRGRNPANMSTRQPLLRSCKVKPNEQNIVNSKRKVKNKSSVKPAKRNKTNSSDNLSHFETAESKQVLLSKIFPNANSDYLLSQSQQITNQEELLMFISQTLDNKNYPLKENDSDLESTKEVMYNFHWNVEELLQEYPDPVAYFSSHNHMRTGYEENAEIYVSSRYQKLDHELMKDLLKASKYNLTTVCAELEDGGLEPIPLCLDQISLHHEPSTLFHQEVWFIEHKTEVQNFLASIEEAVKVEEELNKPVTPVDEVFECAICSEDITEYSELGSCDKPTGHLFCKTCIKRSIEIQIGEGGTTFPCLANCGGLIDLQTVKEVMSEDTFNILMNKIQEEEVRVANIPGVETCPFCHFAYGPEAEDVLFECENPTCMKKSCRACREEDHTPNVCAMLQNENEETARRFIENKMTEALLRQCYKCGKNFVKETGCNKMTCKCGALMCYLCRKPVADYTHFNGPGGDNYNRCELYSDEAKIHVEPVIASAKAAFNELVANNPGINLDASKIIPK